MSNEFGTTCKSILSENSFISRSVRIDPNDLIISSVTPLIFMILFSFNLMFLKILEYLTRDISA